jgi:hypothetical protein
MFGHTRVRELDPGLREIQVRQKLPVIGRMRHELSEHGQGSPVRLTDKTQVTDRTLHESDASATP